MGSTNVLLSGDEGAVRAQDRLHIMTQNGGGEYTGVQPAATATALALDGVTFRYPHAAQDSLSGVTLSVRAGEVVALLGANGAGKSTLLRLAAALLAPTEGRARIDGTDARALPRRAIARTVAFVSQSEQAPTGFRVREVVAMGRAAHQGAWMHEQPHDTHAIEEALRRCDVAALAERRIETLSGGEQRRVAMARALAQKPRLLLLDEPAAFLDVRHRIELYAQVADVARDEGIACLIALHDLDAAMRFASRAVLLQEGRLAVDGPPAEVMTPARLGAALGARVVAGVHPESGERYFLVL
ncbi:MAG TPA: ABC transporter ATP-binding protein [Polyangiaceae bacterium]|nr:ABC transporter ATP-binding protein [Polyangiaceae bacterium]